MDDNDAQLDVHRRRERFGIDRRDVGPAKRARAGDGLEDHVAVRVIVIRRVIEPQPRRRRLGPRRRGGTVRVTMLVRQMRVHEPMCHREHGSRQASEQRSNERQQADGERAAHAGMYHAARRGITASECCQ